LTLAEEKKNPRRYELDTDSCHAEYTAVRCDTCHLKELESGAKEKD
jgi:hypothetical protein